MDEHTTIALRKSTPNREGCAPTVYQAALGYDEATGPVPYRPDAAAT